ncbi:MAG: PDZ domain-containing protein [Pirellulales bacterium]|nr:PDZ domain-containing protein [Pirellulales bacterium]
MIATNACFRTRRGIARSATMLGTLLGCLVVADPATSGEPIADVDLLEQNAVQAAVDRVAPSVVRIETVGGMERVGDVLFGSGPTTGLIVDREGYIISSAFSFLHLPASILVRLPDGSLKPATVVGTDHSRKLVLLKIDAGRPLPVPEVAPVAEMRVGQWAIAVGRTFEGSRPNMSVGIISALRRIWGKAIQTDAAVSPNNYGGPLVDVRGRVLGVLVPLSPQSDADLAGYQWYDSGIGFAVDAEHIMSVLPRLKQGEDLHPGVIGISLQGRNPVIGEPVITACHPNSPAAKAGLKAGDRIVEMAGRPIVRAAGVKAELSRRYAGARVSMVVVREQKRIETEVELVAELQPYAHPFLGVLPMRIPGGESVVAIRYVYPDSPAARAGIESGDVLVSLEGKPIENRDTLLQRLATFQPDEDVELEVHRDGQPRNVKLTLGRLPEDLPPAELPPAHGVVAGEEDRPAVGTIRLKIAELKNDAWAYVPEAYASALPHGVVVLLTASGDFDWPELLTRWKPHCDRHDLVLLAIKTVDAQPWRPDDATTVGRFLDEISSSHAVDSSRVVLLGHESGGTLAFAAAARNRELARAVVAIDGPPGSLPLQVDPLHRMAVYAAVREGSRHAKQIKGGIARLRSAKIPVTVKGLAEDTRQLRDQELAELARWIDMLDRI